MKILNLAKLFSISFFTLLGTLGVFVGQSYAVGTPASIHSANGLSKEAINQEFLILASRDCQENDGMGCQEKDNMDCEESVRGHRGGKGHHRGSDCKDMKHQRGKKHGMKRGMGHGMGHGMGRGPGLDGEAQCPQTRSTARAPENIYNKTNPLENNPDNIEKGRMLFQLDSQPTCTVCHGSGDGLGMMSGGLNPPPRNFMCQETMGSIPDGQLFWIIKNGSEGTGMPSFSDLGDEQIWKLIIFIRTLSE
jgi:mono/diheme cytochrome c family protein